MTENEKKTIEQLKRISKNLGCIGETEDYTDVAISAIEENQRWHTSVINPKIKNVFANISTQICHNCDHKDEYIEELEAEIERYREIERCRTKKYCSTCKWYAEHEGVCCNGSSEHRADFRCLDDTCEKWEENK